MIPGVTIRSRIINFQESDFLATESNRTAVRCCFLNTLQSQDVVPKKLLIKLHHKSYFGKTVNVT